MPEKLGAALKLNTEEKLISDKGIQIQTPKSQLPIVIQSILKLTVPSTKELHSLNEDLQGQPLTIPVDISASKYTDNSLMELTSYDGYADISVLRTLFFVLRLFYKKIALQKKLGKLLENEEQLSGSQMLREFRLPDGGTQYKTLVKHLRFLANTSLHEQTEKVGSSGGLSTLTIKNSIEGLIHLEVNASATIPSKQALDIIGGNRAIIFKVHLNKFLFEQLSKGYYRLIDLDIYEKKLTSNLAKLIYAYVIFHSQTSFSISIKKLCKKLVIKYEDEPISKKHLRSRIKKALAELSTATHNNIVGEVIGDCLNFTFNKKLILAPMRSTDWGICPKCRVGKIVSSISSRDGRRYWYCSQGSQCTYVLDNAPKF